MANKEIRAVSKDNQNLECDNYGENSNTSTAILE